MDERFWTSADIYKLFRLKLSRQTLLNAEQRGEIPEAARQMRGSISRRLWRTDQLPEIGKRFGFLQKPTYQVIVSMISPKGGVLKTTYAYNLSRMLAFNGIKTLIIGLDAIQRSITSNALPKKEIESLEDFKGGGMKTLYSFFYEKVPLKEIIKNTDLPTLDVIPESYDLVSFNRLINAEQRRELLFKTKLIPLLSDYDVIVFDNGANWNNLVECSAMASNNVIMPLGCEIEAFDAINEALDTIIQFKDVMGIKWKNFIQIPTLEERTKLSQQIYAAYVNMFSDNIIPISIKRNAKAQEARLLKKSIFEHDPTSPFAQDYFDAITETWRRITRLESINGA